MANITPTVIPVGATTLQGWQVTWGPMLNSDIGIAVGGMVNVPLNFGGSVQDMSGCSDRSVQVVGTLGAAGNVAWEGSNDGTNFSVLNDAFGNTLNITTATVKQVTEAVLFARPHVTAGDGTTSVTVTAFFRRTAQNAGMYTI